MSRNPYLAASRPSSSFTRSSRTSKRNDLSSGCKGSLLGRSRSSASLGSSFSAYTPVASSYSSAAGSAYSPAGSTAASGSWQRSLSSTRNYNYSNDRTRETSEPSDEQRRGRVVSRDNYRTSSTDVANDSGSVCLGPKLMGSLASMLLSLLSRDNRLTEPFSVPCLPQL